MEHTSRSEGREEMYPEQGAAVSAAIGFLPDLSKTFEQTAQQKEVSLAWVVRDAAGKYITNGIARRRVAE